MITTQSCEYKNEKQLLSFLKENQFENSDKTFIQVFVCNRQVKEINSIQAIFREFLPNAQLLGCTTSELWIDGEIETDKINITIIQFEHTKVKTKLFTNKGSRTNISTSMKKELNGSDLKTIITYTSNRLLNISNVFEPLLTGNKDLVITGGTSTLNDKALIFTMDEMSDDGIGVCALYNERLIVSSVANTDWQSISRPYKITAAAHSRVVSINFQNPKTFLKEYFSTTFIEELPYSSLEFPFLVEENGVLRSYYIKKINDDGTIELNNPVKEGFPFTIGYIDLEKKRETSNQLVENLLQNKYELIFSFQNKLGFELLPLTTVEEMTNLQKFGSVTGFISQSELVLDTDRSVQYQHLSSTLLLISETATKQPVIDKQYINSLTNEFTSRLYLTSLAKKTAGELYELSQTLSYSANYYKSLFKNNADIVFSTDMYGRISSINKKFTETFGIEEQEIIGEYGMRYLKTEDQLRVKRYFLQTIRGKEIEYELQLPNKNGEIQFFRLKNIPIIINESIIGIFCTAHNITKSKKFEERILQLAYYDSDTGLPNRAKMTELINDALNKAMEVHGKLAVMFIDINRFKNINDSFGHHVGDQVLKQLAQQMTTILPEWVTLGKFGGDKFTLLITKNTDVKVITQLSNEIMKVASKPFIINDQEIVLSVSLGISFYPEDGNNADTLLKYADTAVNRAKKFGGNKLVFFSNEMNDQIKYRLELESYLRKAVKKNELFLNYQPLVCLKTGQIIGSEALVRWNHPKLGIIPPMDFIPLAEETGLIFDIGKWVLMEACAQNQMWIDSGLGNLSISVNVSAQQFQHPAFLQQVKEALQFSGLSPNNLQLELTETGMLNNINNTIKIMQELRDLGVKVSIDDFGTGYSSLSYLKNLPIDSLKIDRTFINNLNEEKTVDRSIVEAIITMGSGLAVKTVAEGVETKEQWQELQKLSCDYAQGYFIEKPIDKMSFTNILVQNPLVFA
ncbi:EAL domain-containing protein [Bacillus kwashiorkori]|uniref:EAL domain-containing protein n=1 Tax=Bacillus kwashiorkori TaxID=1522318 RepID=UPI0007853680|nr:EAL domain-containing protein [Bacillus kwashiorkori]